MASREVGFALLLIGCGGGDVEDCEAGFELRDDDRCYATGGGGDASLDVLLDALPACELLDPDGALDLERSCAGPGCVDDTFEELEDAYGPGVCGSIGYSLAECSWTDWDVVAGFADEDGDGAVEPDQRPTGMYVGVDFPGATSDGLAPGVSIRCFLDVYGLPTTMEPSEANDSTWISWWGFDYGAFYVLDRVNAGGTAGGDGMPEYVWLNGPG
jgi:hypothetical protein